MLTRNLIVNGDTFGTRATFSNLSDVSTLSTNVALSNLTVYSNLVLTRNLIVNGDTFGTRATFSNLSNLTTIATGVSTNVTVYSNLVLTRNLIVNGDTFGTRATFSNLSNLTTIGTGVSTNVTVYSNLVVTKNLSTTQNVYVGGDLFVTGNVIGGIPAQSTGTGVSLMTLNNDLVVSSPTFNNIYILPVSSFNITSSITNNFGNSFTFLKTGIYNLITSIQLLDSKGDPDSISNVIVYSKNNDVSPPSYAVYRDTNYNVVGSLKSSLTVPLSITDTSNNYFVGLTFARNNYPYTIKKTYLPSGSNGSSFVQLTFLGASNDTIPLGTDARTLTNIGTTAGSTVTIGNDGQSLILKGSSLTLPSTAATFDLTTTQFFGTSLTGLQSVTVGTSGYNLNLLGTVAVNGTTIKTVATSGNYNDLSNRPPLARLETGFGNAATSTVNVGATGYQLNLNGTVTVNGTTIKTVATSGNYSDLTGTPAPVTTSNSFGNAATSTVVVGTSGQDIVIQGVRNPIVVGGALSDETSILTTLNQVSFRSPFAFTIRNTNQPMFSLNILPTAAAPCTFDILKNGNSIYTAGGLPTISSSASSNLTQSGTLIGNSNSVNFGDLLVARVASVGSGNPAGAKVVIFAA